MITYLFLPALVVALIVAVAWRVIVPLYTLERYRKDHPEHFKAGRVTCKSCAGTSIWMKRTEFFIGKGWAHTCRTCGKELYYSH